MISERYHCICFGGEEISFLVTRTSRRKTVAIAVGFDGVHVLAPKDMSDFEVSKYVRQKAPWVLKKQSMYRELVQEIPAKEFVSGEAFHYLGRPYQLRVIEAEETVLTRVSARGSTLVAPVPTNENEAIRRISIRGGLRHWYISKAKIHFPKRMKMVSTSIGIVAPSLRVVNQSKRWGSCDKSGNIRLNWRLVMAPVSLIDYVIAHELCHTFEHNHSRKFWRSLETIMPDYEERIRRLDSLGHSFIW